MRSEAITAIIFDKDGCLFEFHATWSVWIRDFLGALSHRESVSVEGLAAAVGFDLDAGRLRPDSLVIAETPDDIAAAICPHLPRTSFVQLLSEINNSAAQVELVESVPLRPLLMGLRSEGFALGLATNDAEAPARAHLQSASVLDLFDCIYGSDSGVGAKPGPGQLLAFAEATGIAPHSIAMVGDSLHDMQAARNAGMSAVAVLTGPALASELTLVADAVLPDIGHLPAWLCEMVR